MTTRRQGRFRGDPDPKPAKPVPPLRYRIAPVERDFDNLDMLQAELDREYNAVPPKMDADEYFALQAVIDNKRKTLNSRRAALAGQKVEKDYDSMPFAEDLPVTRLQKLTALMGDKPFEMVLGAAVFFWLMATNGHLKWLTG